MSFFIQYVWINRIIFSFQRKISLFFFFTKTIFLIKYFFNSVSLFFLSFFFIYLHNFLSLNFICAEELSWIFFFWSFHRWKLHQKISPSFRRDFFSFSLKIFGIFTGKSFFFFKEDFFLLPKHFSPEEFLKFFFFLNKFLKMFPLSSAVFWQIKKKEFK